RATTAWARWWRRVACDAARPRTVAKTPGPAARNASDAAGIPRWACRWDRVNSCVDVGLQFSLQKLFGVVEPGANRADGAPHHFGDFLMTEAVNFVQCDHGAMLDRQLLQRLVQFFLKFADKRRAVGRPLVGQLVDHFADVILVVHLLEAEKRAQPVLAQMGQRAVDRDAIQPGKEGGLTLEAVDGLKGLDEGLLRQIRRVLAVGGQIVKHAKETFAVFEDQ